MSVISRAALFKELIPGLNKLFGLEYDRYQQEWKSIYATQGSDRSFEEEVKLSTFGAAPVKPEGMPVSYDTAQEVWTSRYTHETIALAFSLTEEAVEDNLYESLSERYAKAMARSMWYTKEVKAANLFNTGFDTYQSGDGVTVFSTVHPTLSGATNANRPTTAADLSEASLEAAAITISGWRDERNLLIAARPKKLIIPQALQFTATRILASEYRSGTADNDVNALKNKGTYSQNASIWNYLTDTNAWFVTTDVPDGLKHFSRVALQKGEDSDFDTGNMRYRTRERYVFGISDPLGVYGSPGAS